MRAVLCKAWGGPDDLTIGEMAEPDLPETGVRIAVHAAAANFADTLMIKGQYQEKPAFPFAPGLECAGTVIDVAPGVTRLKPGDRVFGVVGHGGFAEVAVAEERRVYRIPDSMDFASAAAFPVAYGTSHMGLILKAGLKAGETVLINGAAGGVGLTAVEIAKHIGATVIASAGGKDKLQVAADVGADHLIDYRSEDIRDRVKAITGGKGVDVVYDPVGGDTFDASLRSTAKGGRMVIVGFASGTVPQIPANILLVKNITAYGFYWGAHFDQDPALMAQSFDELLGWYADGALKPHISHTFALENAADALKALSDRKSTGKVVLTVR
jgi:NADPH2:quinone reductase